MQIRWRFAKNAFANLGRGSAAAIVALLLPPVLVRHMPPAAYAVWVLVLQTAAYVGYLNFGLQTAIGRYVAYAQERDDIEQRDSVFSTAFVGLCGAALLSLLCLAVAIVATPSIFPSVPSQLIPQMRLALLWWVSRWLSSCRPPAVTAFLLGCSGTRFQPLRLVVLGCSRRSELLPQRSLAGR